MATFRENLEKWRQQGAKDKREGLAANPPEPHYLEVQEIYMEGYEQEKEKK